MTALTEFLFPAPAPRHTRAILGWWERRRLGYNLAVGATGVVSLVITRLLLALPPHAPTHVGPLWPPVLVFGVLANVCYFLGPTVEILIEKLWGRRVLPTGPTLFRMGLTYSIGLALLPILLATLSWLFRIAHTIL